MNNLMIFIIIYYLLGVIAQTLGFLTGGSIGINGKKKVEEYIDDIGNLAYLDIFLWFLNLFIVLYYGIVREEPVLIIGALSLLLPPIKIIFSIYIIIKNKINK